MSLLMLIVIWCTTVPPPSMVGAPFHRLARLPLQREREWPYPGPHQYRNHLGHNVDRFVTLGDVTYAQEQLRHMQYGPGNMVNSTFRWPYGVIPYAVLDEFSAQTTYIYHVLRH